MTWKQQSEVQLRVIWVLKCREDKKEQAKENGEKGWMCEREIKEGKRGALIKQTPLILAVPEERFRHYSAKMPVFPLRLTQIHENTHVYAHWTKTSQHWVSDKQHRNKKKKSIQRASDPCLYPWSLFTSLPPPAVILISFSVFAYSAHPVSFHPSALHLHLSLSLLKSTFHLIASETFRLSNKEELIILSKNPL